MESSWACFYRLANSGCATLVFDYFRPDAAPGHGDDRLRVAGERGIIEVAGGEATLLCHERPPCRLEKEEPLSLFEEFVRHLEQGTPMRITAEEAFAVSELALRSREAADTKTIIRLGKAL
jgi:predicted dehydrogenase